MRIRVWGLVMVLVVVVAGCHGNFVDQTSKTEEKEETTSGTLSRDPFTGMPEKGDARSALMVMVNNHAKARPQSGLNRADVVVEILAEGPITRFAAFYHSQNPGKVGPVRSVRPYFLDLAAGMGAVVAHAGGSPAALKRIESERIPSLDGIHGAARYFQREKSRQPPHNLYTDVEQLRQGANQQGLSPDSAVEGPWRFDDRGAVEQGRSASEVEIRYGSRYQVGYRYDEASEEYIRYTQGKKQVDRETNQPLSMNNILVLYTDHQVVDSAGRREVDLKESGKGYLFQKGKRIAIHWENRDGWLVPLVEQEVVPLLPGKTWINILPEDGHVSSRG
ncbi:DUF3048 domain-containing protein [Paludifilum halophilum]|uniref:Lipoprotein YerB n=1 Tax=Paludifilum halophilum TaxID=1642702 RepID=A0A235B5K9_9BACL|nr:DUF3048 domain-containing protein [Paludifilum halophilum]OYD07521.1 hypothetical protein CHM34_11545 [Paludifilum halophilum]